MGMKQILLVAAIIVVALGYSHYERKKQFAAQLEYSRTVATSHDSCAGKKFCALVYVAPWCPACKSILPKLHTFSTNSANSKDYGFKLVVGRERNPGDNEKMAAPFGANGFVDKDSSIHSKLGINYYPTIFIQDQEGTTILKDNEAFRWMHEKLL